MFEVLVISVEVCDHQAPNTGSCQMSESLEHFSQTEQPHERGNVQMSESVELSTQIKKAPKTRNGHISESVEHLAQIDTAGIPVTPSCPPADLRNGKIHWTVDQSSIIKKMKHAAKDDDEQDTSNNDNANDMKNQWFDSAIWENVLQILDMTLPEPRFRSNADHFGLVGTMESGPLKAQKKRLKIAHEPLSCLLYTSPSPRDMRRSRMPSSA